MKLSNKILIAFFGFAFLYLTAVFAEVRFRGTPNIINNSNSIAETVDLPGISHLVFRNVDYRINVMGSDHAQLEVRSLEGELLKTLKHTISGDTLALSDFHSTGRRMVNISVFIPKDGLKGITINGAEVSVKGLAQGDLNLSLESGRIWLSHSEVGKMKANISGRSVLDIAASTLDTLSARIENSEVYIYSPVGRLEGSMENNSFMRMGHINEIHFRKDTTSRLNLYP